MIYGIDLGTTYSAIAGCDESGNAFIIGNPSNVDSLVSASVVTFDEETGKPTVGNSAKNNLKAPGFAEQTLQLFKRQMGKQYCDDQIKLNGRSRWVSPVEGSACILHDLMHSAHINTGKPDNRAVVTIPVSFTYQQRACTKKAAELAGIEVVALLHEPTAAALAYDIQPDETILVFDLGGGTLDVSVVRHRLDENGNDQYDVLGIASDSDLVGVGKHIGGQDWDEALIGLALQSLPGVDSTNRYVKARLAISAEECKKNLSKQPTAPFAYNNDFVVVKRSHFENVTRGLVEQCCRVVKKAVANAQEKAESDNFSLDINRFVLTGGSSNMPMIKRELLKHFHTDYSKGRPDNEWMKLFAPEQAIARGAAICAHLIEQGKYFVEEQSPYSYGTSCVDEFRNRCIKNLLLLSDPMVVEESREFEFFSIGKKGVGVDIYENRNPSDGHFLFNADECRLVGEEYFYKFDHDVEVGTPVKFAVTRDKDGMIGMVVSSEGHHVDRFSIDTRISPISYEVEQQIIRSINLMNEDVIDELLMT